MIIWKPIIWIIFWRTQMNAVNSFPAKNSSDTENFVDVENVSRNLELNDIKSSISRNADEVVSTKETLELNEFNETNREKLEKYRYKDGTGEVIPLETAHAQKLISDKGDNLSTELSRAETSKQQPDKNCNSLIKVFNLFGEDLIIEIRRDCKLNASKVCFYKSNSEAHDTNTTATCVLFGNVNNSSEKVEMKPNDTSSKQMNENNKYSSYVEEKQTSSEQSFNENINENLSNVSEENRKADSNLNDNENNNEVTTVSNDYKKKDQIATVSEKNQSTTDIHRNEDITSTPTKEIMNKVEINEETSTKSSIEENTTDVIENEVKTDKEDIQTVNKKEKIEREGKKLASVTKTTEISTINYEITTDVTTTVKENYGQFITKAETVDEFTVEDAISKGNEVNGTKAIDEYDTKTESYKQLKDIKLEDVRDVEKSSEFIQLSKQSDVNNSVNAVNGTTATTYNESLSGINQTDIKSINSSKEDPRKNLFSRSNEDEETHESNESDYIANKNIKKYNALLSLLEMIKKNNKIEMIPFIPYSDYVNRKPLYYNGPFFEHNARSFGTPVNFIPVYRPRKTYYPFY